jgi:hypothetical protein
MAERIFPRYIFGMHDPGGEHLMAEKARQGWIVFTHELGHDPAHRGGFNYRPWSDRGLGPIARLNHGYGRAGTIPRPALYASFAHRVRNWVEASEGCHIWIIGNEPNHPQERPDGQAITPYTYATCFNPCREQIHSLPGHEDDQVTLAAIAPWNNQTTYPGNPSGDWIQYFQNAIRSIRQLGGDIDAIALHTYTHGADPDLVFSDAKMGLPFQDYHYSFRAYRDFMRAIPDDLAHLPVYITETNQDVPWENANRGWVQNAYREINDWNTGAQNQQIRALVLYRWQFDRWHIDDKFAVQADFQMALDHEYLWRPPDRVRQINGYEVHSPFLEFFETQGERLCGLPISDETVEYGLRTQYFQRLVLQQNASGQVIVQRAVVELLGLRQDADRAAARIQELQVQVETLRAELEEARGGRQIVEVVRPLWENVVYQLPRHATDRYERRPVTDIDYLVITHSAAPASVTPSAIARFHVGQMGWPGIGYHFYIDGSGAIFQTNDLTTTSFHVREWNPVSVSVCVGGNFTNDIPNPPQLASTAHLLAWLLQELDLPMDAVRGKSELIDTQSPGRQWLSGSRWKTLLLDQIAEARYAQARSHPVKPLYHYLLFWQTADRWAQEDWQGARPYAGRFRVMHGFSFEEAQHARYVTVVGGTEGVGRAEERTLLDAGCRVERIAGQDQAETAQILADMAHRGQRFLNLNG